jgi:hypothetical protein
MDLVPSIYHEKVRFDSPPRESASELIPFLPSPVSPARAYVPSQLTSPPTSL